MKEGVDTRAFCNNKNSLPNCQKIIQCHVKVFCLLSAWEMSAVLKASLPLSCIPSEEEISFEFFCSSHNKGETTHSS